MSHTNGHSGNRPSEPGPGQGPRAGRSTGDRTPAQDRARPAGPKAPTPTIVIDPDIARVVDQSLAALRAAGAPLYQRSHQLVHVLVDGGKLRGITRPPGTPHIVPLSAARLRELMATTATWVRPRRGPAGEPEHVPALPPDWAVAALLGRGTWATIPYLEAVTECPVLRPDGSILEAPGYDPTTGLLYHPSTAFPPAPPAPDATAARAAVTQLLDVVCDFPFASDAHRAAWLAGLLTPLARYAFRGPAPLLLIDANTRGAGKSLLADVTAEILAGRPMARMPPTENDAEERKRITALAHAGDPLVLIDNV